MLVPWLTPDQKQAAAQVIDDADSPAVLHALAQRLAVAGSDELEGIAAGLERYGYRVEAARARADARMAAPEQEAEA